MHNKWTVLVNALSREEWDGFVNECRDSTLAHLYGWKDVIKKSYGHDGYYLSVTDGRKTVGVLPLISVRSRLFANELVSMPYLDYGGVLVRDGVDDREGIARSLLQKALQLSWELGVNNINIRQLAPLDTDWEERLEKVTMLFEMVEDEDRLLRSLPSERRNRIRKAMRNGLSTEVTGRDGLDEFYEIFVQNMRDLGSPVHSKEFIACILDEFPDSTRVFIVRQDAKAIGSAIAFFHKDTVSVPWVSSLRSHFSLYPNIALYWEIMKYARARGISCFDFGRSTVGSGTFEFKRRWGASSRQIYWYDSSAGGRSAATAAQRHSRMIEIWKRIPVPVTRVLGPMLRGGITN